MDRVAVGRGLGPQRVDALAGGRVWTGAQAHERGLVDALGGFHEALARAKDAAGIDPDADVDVVTYPRPPSLMEQLGRGLGARARAWLADRAPPGLDAGTRAALAAAAAPAGEPALVPPFGARIR